MQSRSQDLDADCKITAMFLRVLNAARVEMLQDAERGTGLQLYVQPRADLTGWLTSPASCLIVRLVRCCQPCLHHHRSTLTLKAGRRGSP
jgi:hypothetical protein